VAVVDRAPQRRVVAFVLVGVGLDECREGVISASSICW
jgi:hypothetical protein